MPNQNTLERTEIQYLRHDLPKIREFLLSRSKKPELSLNTMPDFNNFIFGLRKKEMVVVGARPSEGKSTFSAQMAFDLASQGHQVLFLSLEMTTEKVGARLFCYQKRFNNSLAFRGGLQDKTFIIDQFEQEVANFPLIINDMLGKDWKDIDDLIQTTDYHPDVVIVDYIQTIARSQKMNRLEEINEYIRHFREMAIKQNFCGIICSQINRSSQEGNDKRPQAHQLKSSGFLEEHADVLLLLHWPHKYGHQDITKFQVFVAKNKDGMTGYFDLKFEPEFYCFSNATKEEKKQSIDEKDINWAYKD